MNDNDEKLAKFRLLASGQLRIIAFIEGNEGCLSLDDRESLYRIAARLEHMSREKAQVSASQ